MENLKTMRYKQIRFTESVDRWLSRHRDIKAIKILNIVRHKSGELFYNDNCTYTIRTGVVFRGKNTNLYIKVKENKKELILDVLVKKIHIGHLTDLTVF